MSEPFSKSIQKRIEHQVGEKLYTQADLDLTRMEGEHKAYAAVERHILGTEDLQLHTGEVIDRVLKQAIAAAEEATVELIGNDHRYPDSTVNGAVYCQCGQMLVADYRNGKELTVEAWRTHLRALVKTPGNLATFEAEIRRQERERVMLEVRTWPYVPYGTYEQWCSFVESKLAELSQTTAPPTAASEGAEKGKP